MTYFFRPPREASICFVVAVGIFSGCTGAPESEAESSAPQAVRVVSTRVGPMIEGQEYLAEVVPYRSVNIIARVAGTLGKLPMRQNSPATKGDTLAEVLTPDIAARFRRVRAERQRAESGRDFACEQAATDQVLFKSGDIPGTQADVSAQNCKAARLSSVAAMAAQREALVTTKKGTERAPFNGQVLQIQG